MNQATLHGGKVRVQVKANPDGESFVIFNNGEAKAVDGMTGAYTHARQAPLVVCCSLLWAAEAP